MDTENEVQGQEIETPHYEEPSPSGTDDSGSQSDLYAPYLEKFPTSLHPIATEVFKEWDGNVTRRIQSVHEEYEPYKPFVEQYEPDAIAEAVAIAEAMERDPQAFVQAIMDAYGIAPPQAMQYEDAPELQSSPLDYDDPAAQRLQQHEELLRTMAETMLNERREREEAIQFQQEEQEYEALMENLQGKYGDFDTAYVNSLLAQGIDPDAAVQHWQSTVEQYAQRRLAPNQNAPIVMGSGGGTPSIQRDTENLSSKETRALVEQMLRAANGG